VDELKIRLFDLNSGPLRGIVQATQAWVDANKDVILTRVQEFIDGVVKRLPEIVKWTKRIATGLAVFYAFAAAVKVAQVAIAAYEIAVKVAAFSTKAWRLALAPTKAILVGTTKALGLFNAEAAAGQAGLAGLRTGLNASALGKSINGVTGLLGQAGLLGAAAAVGFAFGTWLDHTFKLSDKLADVLAQITGIDKALSGRHSKQGIQPGDQEIAGGTMRDAKGNIVKWGEPNDVVAAHEQRKGFLANESAMSKMRMTPAMKAQFQRSQDKYHSEEDAALERAARDDLRDSMHVVSPQERTTRAITESIRTTTDKAEITIKDETGKARVTKQPKGPTRLRLQPSGAF
jgi:hypothetical protein